MSFFWVDDSNEQIAVPMKFKRKAKPKMEFLGWGSRPLIEFLESNGKDYSKQLSQYDVAAIINEYVNKHNLLHPVKKKRIVCDEWLYSLFGKKSVPRIKIYDLLEAHFAENHDSSEDDLLYSSEEQDEVVRSSKKRKISYQKKQVPETPKSCFAAIIPENIKLLYLKRSLVQDLLKTTETFEGKVVGSYVRIKSDPNDYSQKHSHQLLPVTGVITESGDVGKEILLQVPNVIKAVPIHLLSEDNFSEEECEDLRQRVKDGLLRRPTVGEFEQKARILHEDITKHWLPRELSLLQNLMDRANEKGWRRELYEYSQRKQLLQSPKEQSRLLLEVPKIIGDELEPDPTLQEPVENAKQGISSSPTSILRDASISSADSGANLPKSSLSPDAEGSRVAAIPPQDVPNSFPVDCENKRAFLNGITSTRGSDGIRAAFETYKQQKIMEVQPIIVVQQQKGLCMPTKNESIFEMQVVNCGGAKGSQKVAEKQVPQVIELSDDEDTETTKDVGCQFRIIEHPESVIWFYLDPQGHAQGPFPMTALKRWYDASYFQPGFKVWKRDQTPNQGALLSDLLREMFRN